MHGDDPQLDRARGRRQRVRDGARCPAARSIGRIPSGACKGALPDRLPAGQLLDAYVDWDVVLERDQVGKLRDDGGPCDIGAVQTPFTGLAPPGDRPAVPAPEPATATPTVAESPAAVATVPGVRLRPARGGSVRHALAQLERRLDRLERLSKRFEVMLGCTTRIGVRQLGDIQHRWGFRYDERDGTGEDQRPALVRTKRHGDWDLLRMSTRKRCLSLPVDPNGTGEDARPQRDLWRWLHRLERQEDRVEARTEVFDAWESCVSALPVTEAGDAEQDLGFLTGDGVHLPAVDIDASEWDDPDYQLLAFRDRDHPFRPGPCGTDPGEAADRPAVPHRGPDGGAQELRRAIAALREGVADLGEPVAEITQFDECLYTVGLTERPGYLYRSRSGAASRRPALSFDMRGNELPQLSVMAFPGEEPPQIECNEDASGASTDE